MELNSIKSNSTWGQAASDLNENFGKVSTEMEKVKNATTRNKGYFDSEDSLKNMYKTASVGDIAYVGKSYPYKIWKWNGTEWGDTNQYGGDEAVELGNYYTKDETDEKVDELEQNTDAKLSELGSEVGYMLDIFYEGYGAYWNVGSKEYAPNVPVKYEYGDESDYTKFQCVREIPVKKGDRFVLTTSGRDSSRAYVLTDETRLIVERADANARLTDFEIVAKSDGFLLVNCTNAIDTFKLIGYGISNKLASAQSEIIDMKKDLEGIDKELSDVNNNLSGEISKVNDELLIGGFLNVNALNNESYSKRYTLGEAIEAVPQKYRMSAKGIVFMDNYGRQKCAVFNSLAYVSGWTTLLNWEVVDFKTIREKGDIAIQQPIGTERTDNIFDWRTYTSYKNLKVYDTGKRYDINDTSVSLVVAEIKTGQTIWFKFWLPESVDIFSEYSIKNINIKTVSTETVESGTIWVDRESASWANKRANLTSTIDGYAVLTIEFNNVNSRDAYILPLLKKLTARSDGYGASYADYYKLIVNSSDLSEELLGKFNAESGKLDRNQGIDNAGKTMIVGSDGNIIPGDLSENGDLTDVVKRVAITRIPVGPNLLENKTLGNGWSESNNVISHAGGEEPVVFEYQTKVGEKYLLRMTITNPKEDRLFVTIGDYPKVDVYNGGENISVGFVSEGGNVKIIPTSDWIGTIENIRLQNVVSKENAVEEVVYNNSNVEIMPSSSDITSYWNLSISGDDTALSSTQNSTRNIAIGNKSLRSLKTGTRNVAIGTFALSNLLNGDRNVAVGSDALWFVKYAEDCVSVGKNSIGRMQLDAVYKRCTAVGGSAMCGPYGGSEDSVAVGYNSMGGYNSKYLSPKYVTSVGSMAGHYGGDSSTYVGYRAGYYQKGHSNTCIGSNTQSTYVDGSKQTLIGAGARPMPSDQTPSASNVVSIDNVVAIGYAAIAEKSNQTVIGNQYMVETKVFGDLVVRGVDGVVRRIIFNQDGSCSWETV